MQEVLNVAQARNPTVPAGHTVITLGTDERPSGGGGAWKWESQPLLNCEILRSAGHSTLLTLTLISVRMDEIQQ
jgi:hypothetical protein